MTDIKDARLLIIAADGFEPSELRVPRDELSAMGATVHLATPDGQPIRPWEPEGWGTAEPADLRIADARVSDYHGLVIPGGQINPDTLRTKREAVELVKAFAGEGRVVAAICHGPWLLAEAGLCAGREMTSWRSLRTDLENAGADWVDREVAVSNGIITSRSPDDLSAFVARIVEELAEGRHDRAGIGPG
jgi:protease I